MSNEQMQPEREQQKARLRLFLRAQIARQSDEQLEEGMGRMRLLAERLTRTRVDRSQVRNLENLAYTTNKVSDITDLLKKSVGRDSRNRGWASDNLGQELIARLEALRAEADRIIKTLPDELRSSADDDLPRRVHLELCRELVKHLTAEFMYRKREA